jgi:NAD(P)-dependent dehydrogenase (short-subunit alcohol dehydrogenase family)/NH3-dependent NAD+ synthetase
MKTEKVTVITGGGRGIGRAIALRMSALTSVLVVGRTATELEAVCTQIRLKGGNADYCVGDVGLESTAALALAKVREHGWTVRNLVCNAGTGKGGPVTTFDSNTWRNMFETNVHGAFYFLQAFLPEMIAAREGAVSIISSTAGLQGAKNDAAYSATKFALVGMAQSIAEEVRKHNIVVVPICPGFVDTNMTRRTLNGLMQHGGMSEQQAVELISSKNIQGRILAPQEVAEAVAFCSTAARLDQSGKPLLLTGDTDSRVLKLVNWVHQNAARAKKLLIPISGGSDSALCFAACARAYPDKVVGVYMGPRKNLRCFEWFESVGNVIYHEETLREGDAEIARWATFLEMSKNLSAWLVGSRNKTEEITGLYSLASRVATFMPLSNIWKSDVMELCDQVGVPAEIMASSRRADPDCGRPEELSEIPLEKIDLYLKVQEGLLASSCLESLTAQQVGYLAHVVDQNQHKQFLPTRGPDLSWSDS